MLKAKAFFTRLAFGSHRDLKFSEDVFILEWKEWVERQAKGQEAEGL